MKTIGIAVSLLLALQAFGQNSEWHLKGQLPDSSVKAFVVHSEFRSGYYVLVYKNENQWDTLEFESNGVEYNELDFFQLEAIQIDGKGLKEIMITWNSKTSFSNNVSQNTLEQTINEIWNLDLRKEIFSAVNHYYRSDYETDHVTGHEVYFEECYYNYNFSIDGNGQITISDLKSSCNNWNYNWVMHKGKWKRTDGIKNEFPPTDPVDKKEGVYIFKDEEYVLVEK